LVSGPLDLTWSRRISVRSVIGVANFFGVWATSEFQLRESSLEIFDDLGGDDVWIGEIGAVFEAFVFASG